MSPGPVFQGAEHRIVDMLITEAEAGHNEQSII